MPTAGSLTCTEPAGNMHPVVTMPYPFNGWDAIEIDAELAPLVRALWDAGIDTECSCQEDGTEPAWIELATDQAVRLAALTGPDITWSVKPLTVTIRNRKTGTTREMTMPESSVLYFPRSDARKLAELVTHVAVPSVSGPTEGRPMCKVGPERSEPLTDRLRTVHAEKPETRQNSG